MVYLNVLNRIRLERIGDNGQCENSGGFRSTKLNNTSKLFRRNTNLFAKTPFKSSFCNIQLLADFPYGSVSLGTNNQVQRQLNTLAGVFIEWFVDIENYKSWNIL